jgi:hypothetical protein
MDAWIYSAVPLLYCVFHFIALLLSVIFWKRFPKACVLLMAGALLNLLASGARFATPVIFRHLQDHTGFTIFGLGISLVNLLGSSLYLTAIFKGRRPDRSRLDADDDDDWDRPASDLAPSPRDSRFREH